MDIEYLIINTVLINENICLYNKSKKLVLPFHVSCTNF